MLPDARWERLMARSEDGLRLAEAAAVVSAHRDPDVDPDALLARLDEIATSVPGRDVDAVRAHLFDTLGFDGDRSHYHHERNSLLHQVLDRRRGLPILLSIITIDVARAVGVELVPISMPGHFLVRVASEADSFLDPFDGGAPIDAEGCERLFRRSNGPSVPFDPDEALRPVGAHAVIARMLANLKGTYAASGDRANLLWVCQLRLSVPGVPLTEAFDLAAVLAGLGRFDEAADALDELAGAGAGGASEEAGRQSRILRARLN